MHPALIYAKSAQGNSMGCLDGNIPIIKPKSQKELKISSPLVRFKKLKDVIVVVKIMIDITTFKH